MINKSIKEIPTLVRELYSIVDRLQELFPERRFTPDGHLVGSLGEVLVAAEYGLELLPSSSEGHDAVAEDGRKVQIKATRVRRVALSSEPEYLVVIQIQRDGSIHEVFNGPGNLAWEVAGKMQKNGQRPISLAKLERLMDSVPDSDQIQRPAMAKEFENR